MAPTTRSRAAGELKAFKRVPPHYLPSRSRRQGPALVADAIGTADHSTDMETDPLVRVHASTLALLAAPRGQLTRTKAYKRIKRKPPAISQPFRRPSIKLPKWAELI